MNLLDAVSYSAICADASEDSASAEEIRTSAADDNSEVEAGSSLDEETYSTVTSAARTAPAETMSHSGRGNDVTVSSADADTYDAGAVEYYVSSSSVEWVEDASY